MGHIHDVYDADKHFIIDPVTRTITYAESDKLILIQLNLLFNIVLGG